MSNLPATLVEQLLSTIHDENLLRYEANAAEPYIHDVYELHSKRVYRLVEALADGDEVLANRFGDALHDTVYDGLAWQRKAFKEIEAESRYQAYIDAEHE